MLTAHVNNHGLQSEKNDPLKKKNETKVGLMNKHLILVSHNQLAFATTAGPQPEKLTAGYC